MCFYSSEAETQDYICSKTEGLKTEH